MHSKIPAIFLIGCLLEVSAPATAKPFCPGKVENCRAAQAAARLPPAERRFAADCYKEMARLEAAGESVGGRTDPKCQKYYGMADDLPVVEPPPELHSDGPCVTTTGKANVSNFVSECKAVSGANKRCSETVSCSEIMRQTVVGCETARRTGQNYKQFCVNYPANLGLPDD